MKAWGLTAKEVQECIDSLHLCAALQDFEATKTDTAIRRAEFRGAVVAFRTSARMLEDRLDEAEAAAVKSDQATTPHVGVKIPAEARLPTEEQSSQGPAEPDPWWRRQLDRFR